jgi:hypothetical protein
MLARAAGLAIDVRLVARRITGTPVLGLAIGSAASAMLALLWFVSLQWRAAHLQRAPC